MQGGSPVQANLLGSIRGVMRKEEGPLITAMYAKQVRSQRGWKLSAYVWSSMDGVFWVSYNPWVRKCNLGRLAALANLYKDFFLLNCLKWFSLVYYRKKEILLVTQSRTWCVIPYIGSHCMFNNFEEYCRSKGKKTLCIQIRNILPAQSHISLLNHGQR